MTNKYVDQLGRLKWNWLKDAQVGFRVILREGKANAYGMAKRYGRKIRTESLPNGDYTIEVID